MATMNDVLDLDRFPIDRPEAPRAKTLVDACRKDLEEKGMFNLEGLVLPAALVEAVAEVRPLLDHDSFFHKRCHNVYFDDEVPALPPDHPALRRLETTNHTVCADQIPQSLVCRIYAWPPLAGFLAAVMQRPRLHTMSDPLARVNVMAYRDGEALNWHFDRAEFTTTLLLQRSEEGGDFQYRNNLRSEADPNYEGVARLLEGKDPEVETLTVVPGTLNVFKGRNTLHRVSPVKGERERIIAIFSYYERPGVQFSAEERKGFYGRVA